MALILVVDDREEACESIKASLQTRDHAVHTLQRVDDGIKALRHCRDRDDWPFDEPYAVAIIDLRFDKGYDGTDFEVAGMHVVKEALQVPFLEPIVLTAFPSVVTAQEALEKGVFRYVTKAERLHDDEHFIKRLVKVVDLALENREVMKTLHESLAELRRCFRSMKSEKEKGTLLSAAEFYLGLAEKSYDIILRARGRHPSLRQGTE